MPRQHRRGKELGPPRGSVVRPSHWPGLRDRPAKAALGRGVSCKPCEPAADGLRQRRPHPRSGPPGEAVHVDSAGKNTILRRGAKRSSAQRELDCERGTRTDPQGRSRLWRRCDRTDVPQTPSVSRMAGACSPLPTTESMPTRGNPGPFAGERTQPVFARVTMTRFLPRLRT